MTFTVDLPEPPSTNNLFANSKTGGRYPVKGYVKWRREAGQLLSIARPPSYIEPVELTIVLSEKSRKDLSNVTKAVEDLLVEHRVIPDDSKAHVRAISLRWGDVQGVRVSIQPAAQAGREAA